MRRWTVHDAPNVALKVNGQTMGQLPRRVCPEQRAVCRVLREGARVIVGTPNIQPQVERHRCRPARPRVKRARVGDEVRFVPASRTREIAAQIRGISVRACHDAIGAWTIDRLHCQRVDVDASSSTGRTRDENISASGCERIRIASNRHRRFEGNGFVRVVPINLAVLMCSDPDLAPSIHGHTTRPRVGRSHRNRRQDTLVVLSEKLRRIVRIDDAVVVHILRCVDDPVVVAIDAVGQIAGKFGKRALFAERSVDNPNVTARIDSDATRTIAHGAKVAIRLRCLRARRLPIDRHERGVVSTRLFAGRRI